MNRSFAGMYKFLVIQTAFTGDVVLATAIVEKIHASFPDAEISFLLRKGNEGLLVNHPFLREVHIWDKKAGKYSNLLKMAAKIRKEGYTHVINAHRFLSSGLITALSGAGYTTGFDKNPLSFLFKRVVKHIISEPGTTHPVLETERCIQLIADITDAAPAGPRLYPGADDFLFVEPYKNQPFVTISPSSVWFTKRYPTERWAELIESLPGEYTVYLLGGPGGDIEVGNEVIGKVKRERVINLCGKLNFLRSAALMRDAAMNYSNDSAPLHFASAMNAPVTGVFTSTVAAFGFGPTSQHSRIVEVEGLYCKPCGLHGRKACPEGHFKCACDLKNEQLLWWTSKAI